MAHRGITANPADVWCYRCRTCGEVFTSSQGLAGHQQKHISEGTWIKGAPHEKFLCPSTEMPAIYRQLGKRKSTPTVLRGQGRFYRPRPRNPMVQGPRRLLGRPRSISNQSHQATDPLLARFKAHLTKKEKEVILSLLSIAKETGIKIKQEEH